MLQDVSRHSPTVRVGAQETVSLPRADRPSSPSLEVFKGCIAEVLRDVA